MSIKRELGRAAYRHGDYETARDLAERDYEETGNPHSALNSAVANHALGNITKEELNQTVDDLGLGGTGHGQSVKDQGH